MGRPRIFELTDQQQHILDLMAHGRTNHEIAEDLGISLDGAKYHVRQVFDKLGVDSREEAVAAWRESHGLLARLRALLWPIGVVAAGGMAVVAGGAVAAAIGLSGGGSPTSSSALPSPTAGASVTRQAGLAVTTTATPPAHTPTTTPSAPTVSATAITSAASSAPGVWVAEVESAPNEPKSAAPIGPVKIFNAADPSSAQVFSNYTAYGVRTMWSPDGHAVAFGGNNGPAGRSHAPAQVGVGIISRTPTGWRQAFVPTPIGPPAFNWSPDNQLLGIAVTTSGTALMELVDDSGHVLTSVHMPMVGHKVTGPNLSLHGPSSTMFEGPSQAYWSPDGHSAAFAIGPDLVVITPKGANGYTTQVYKAPANETQIMNVWWMSATTFDLLTQIGWDKPVGAAYTVTIDGTHASWNKLPSWRSLPPPVSDVPDFTQPIPSNVAAVLKEAPGVRVGPIGFTADGNDEIFGSAIASPAGAAPMPSTPVVVQIAVESASGKITTVSLSPRNPDGNNAPGASFDVVDVT